jgi:exodeoxyribonuclease VII small subunit
MKKTVNTPDLSSEESFEAGVARLTKLVSALESQELNLDEAIKAFEEGVVLGQILTDKLTAAEAQLETLTKGPDGLLTTKPLILEDAPTIQTRSTEEDE